VLWLKEGDKCTKFFHSIANLNKRYNSIDTLMLLQIITRLVSTLSSSIKSYFLSNAVGGLW
jgi:hypothetical protein